MLKWALLCLVLGLVAGALGYTTIAGASFAVAKVLFFLLLVVFLTLLAVGVSTTHRISRR